MEYAEEEKKVYYNKIMVQDTMSVEEAENIIDEMYQDRYKVIEEKNTDGTTIHLNKIDDVKFTNLEFASVRMLRETQSLRRKLEKQQKEIERLQNKDKEYMKILNNNLEWQEKYNELKNDSIPKEAIREKIEQYENLLMLQYFKK